MQMVNPEADRLFAGLTPVINGCLQNVNVMPNNNNRSTGNYILKKLPWLLNASEVFFSGRVFQLYIIQSMAPRLFFYSTSI